jgi:periplasmic protein TonB
MRTASFLILSVSLHAAALSYPITFAARRPTEAVRVTILPVASESLGGSTSGHAAPQGGAKSILPAVTRPVVAARLESKPPAATPQKVAVAEVGTANDGADAWISAITELAAAHANAITDSPGGSPRKAGGETGHGVASNGHGAGSGTGNGAGSGSGSSGDGGALIQASYRDTTQPEYPESARREGREGRVLLRVLIDDHGRTKTVEINTSSGSSILDRAAAEAIRRWSFHPARYGDQPVESWLRIPIEFRLADTKSW